eukprot:PhF_6_TR12310/c0_g1_i1/m.19557
MALRGITVLEMSYLLPGPFAGLILSDMGADVIKIEDPKGDGMRASPIPATFDSLNRGKKSVVLDLKTKSGIDAFLQLAQSADVVIQGYRPGVLERLGIGIETLRAKFPKLIVCSITGYGLTGPNALRAGHDANYLSLAGVLGMTATPAMPPTQIADIAGGTYPAVMQILAALYARTHNGGNGCVIDVSMCDNSYVMLGVPYAIEQATKMNFGGGKYFLCGAVPCYELYPCKDKGFVSVGCIELKFWVEFVKALGLPASLEKKAHAMGPAGTEVKRIVGDAIRTRTRQEWIDFLKDKDLMCEVVLEGPVEASQDKHLRERVVPIKTTSGSVVLPTPLRMDQGNVAFRTQKSPKLGEHTHELLPHQFQTNSKL